MGVGIVVVAVGAVVGVDSRVVVVVVVGVGVGVLALVGRLVLLPSRRGAIRLLRAVSTCTLTGVGYTWGGARDSERWWGWW